MKNNRLCAGLALLVCLVAVPVCAQPGLSGTTLAQTSTSQGFLLSAGAKVTLGVVAAGLGAYGLYRLYKRRSERAYLEGLEQEVQLEIAAGRGCVDIVQSLLQAGADVGATDWRRWTPLYRAAANGHDTIVSLLLAAGADANAVVINGLTALHGAAMGGHEAVVRLLLEFGVEANASLFGCTPLYRAAKRGHEGTAVLLATRGAIPLMRAACERIISRIISRSDAGDRQRVRAGLEQLQAATKQASLERKQVIESTLNEVKVDSEWLPRDLQKLIIKMSEHPDVITWWRKVERDRLCAVSDMRLPIEALKRIVTFDSPQDSRLFRGMLE